MLRNRSFDSIAQARRDIKREDEITKHGYFVVFREVYSYDAHNELKVYLLSDGPITLLTKVNDVASARRYTKSEARRVANALNKRSNARYVVGKAPAFK